jgi:hypothetical protein
VEGGCERNKVAISLGRGAFNISNIVQLVEGGCERNKVAINCTILETLNAHLPKGLGTCYVYSHLPLTVQY